VEQSAGLGSGTCPKLVFLHLRLELVHDLVSGHVGLLMENIFFCRLVNLREFVLGRFDLFAGLQGNIPADIPEKNDRVADCGSSAQEHSVVNNSD
jgi:hypothetical protein